MVRLRRGGQGSRPDCTSPIQAPAAPARVDAVYALRASDRSPTPRPEVVGVPRDRRAKPATASRQSTDEPTVIARPKAEDPAPGTYRPTATQDDRAHQKPSGRVGPILTRRCQTTADEASDSGRNGQPKCPMKGPAGSPAWRALPRRPACLRRRDTRGEGPQGGQDPRCALPGLGSDHGPPVP